MYVSVLLHKLSAFVFKNISTYRQEKPLSSSKNMSVKNMRMAKNLPTEKKKNFIQNCEAQESLMYTEHFAFRVWAI